MKAPRAALLTVLALAAAGCDDATLPAPDGPPRLTPVAGNDAVGLAGVPLADSLVVRVTDDRGPVAGAEVRWTALGGGEIRPTVSRTDADGLAMALWTPGVGPDSAEAATDGVRAVFRARGDAAAGDGVWWGRNRYVEYRAGTLPLILSAPHGGTAEPTEVPDRTWGTTVSDRNTELLAFAVADALEARLGGRPHVVVSHLHRRKLDPNRELEEAAQDDPRAEQAWREFHGFIEHASARVVAEHGEGFYIDLHGHGHAIQRLELGYLLTASELAQSDAALDRGNWSAGSSVRTLVEAAGVPLSAVVRGPHALGSLLEARGYPAVPSDRQPDPGDDPFFSGGYNTWRHASAHGGPVSGVQIEAHYPGIRDSAEHRAAFAAALAETLDVYLARWY